MILKSTFLMAALAFSTATVALADEKAADKKQAAKAYPLKTCIVSGEKLGEHGDPYVFAHEGKEIKLCCKACLKDFKKDTAKYLKKLDAGKSSK